MHEMTADGRTFVTEFFVARSPSLPFDVFEEWGRDMEGPHSVSEGSDLQRHEIVSRDRAVLRARLRAWTAQPIVREALLVASAGFVAAIDEWVADPESNRGARVERVLVRYLARMTGRTTPFGLFAGYSLGAIGPRTDLHLGSGGGQRRHTRLDTGYVIQLARKLGLDRVIREAVKYWTNPTLHQIGGLIQYVEEKFEGAGPECVLVSASDSEEMRTVTRLAESGAGFHDLCRALVGLGNSTEASSEFLHALIDARVLLSEIDPPVTGDEPQEALTKVLERTGLARSTCDALKFATGLIATMDRGVEGADSVAYQYIIENLGTPLEGGGDPSRLFQVDLLKAPSRATLGVEVVEEMLKGAEWLRQLFPPFDSDFREFCERFVSRYETREVELLAAIDDNFGIGPLRDAPGHPGGGKAFVENPWDRQAALMELVTRAIEQRSIGVELTDDLVERLRIKNAPPLPDAFGIQSVVEGATTGELASDDWRILFRWCTGPSGVGPLGRFCHGDSALAEAVRAHLRAEERLAPNVIYAEVAHLSAPRFGNIACRPCLRDYEIACLTRSGADPSKQIPLHDLTLSFREGRLILRSQRLGEEVVPRVTTAVNPGHVLNAPVYRLLWALSQQGVHASVGWDWEGLGGLPFLPRVYRGRTVFSRARWKLSSTELATLDRDTAAARYLATQELRARRRLPRRVLFGEGDRHLPIDLDSTLSVDSFIDLAKGQESAFLLEMYPDPGRLAAYGPEGRFCHEVLVPFASRSRASSPRVHVHPTRTTSSRTFIPGSEWLYVKLYAGRGLADRIIRDFMSPMIARLEEVGAITRWYFVRYSDPESHIRLRLKGSPESLATVAMPIVTEHAARMSSIGLVWRVQFDTYEQEVERYGGTEGMDAAETFFGADSRAVVEVLSATPNRSDDLVREALVLRGAEGLLDSWHLNADDKVNFLARLIADASQPERKIWNQTFRARRDALPRLDDDNRWLAGNRAFEKRQVAADELARNVFEYERLGLLRVSSLDLLGSYLHMYLNRVLPFGNVEAERCCYAMLRLHHRSSLGRQRYEAAS